MGRNSLREAIARANRTPGTQTINIAVNGTINLARALPNIASNIVLRGSGADRITVQRNTNSENFRIFTVNANASFTVSGLSITGGKAFFGGGIGAKRLNGGTGIDTANYSKLTGNQIINLTTGVGRFPGSNIVDRLISIENVIGGGGNDIITGNATNNVLNGGNGRDRITGNAGNDSLVGGLGNDTLTGGVGRDRFTFQTRNQRIDRITDFAPIFDTITISAAGFGGGLRRGVLAPTRFQLGARATDFNDRFIYNRASGVLSFDADGTGSIAQIAIATLNSQLPLTHADILVT